MKNIRNLISYKKVYIDFCRQTHPSSQNGHILPQMVFWNFFNINRRTSARFSHSRINFVVIKLSPNALLFEKLQNECKNPSFFHKVACIRSDHAGAVVKVLHSWLYTLGGFGCTHIRQSSVQYFLELQKYV